MTGTGRDGFRAIAAEKKWRTSSDGNEGKPFVPAVLLIGMNSSSNRIPWFVQGKQTGEDVKM